MIQTIERLEQEVYALKMEAISPSQIKAMDDELKCERSNNESLRRLLRILETERNTLSQVIRMFISKGKIDPVRETKEHEDG